MKKYMGNNTLSSLMKNVLGVVPSSVITDDETQQMWDGLDEPVIEVAPDGELSNWSYTLDENNHTVTLNQYKNTTATDVIVYPKYQLDGVEYNTRIKSNRTDSSSYMFSNKSDIQTIIFKWGIDTSDVTSMSHMFYDCQALTSISGLEYFNTSNVTNMGYMFWFCQKLTEIDLSSFDTSKVTKMDNMFGDCWSLTTINGLENIDVSKVWNMSNMFYDCEALTSLDLSKWNTSNVTNMYNMFCDCYALASLNIKGWNTSKVNNMSYMFCDCKNLTSLDLTSFDTSKVTTMQVMFDGCKLLTSVLVTVGKWLINNVNIKDGMFRDAGCTNVTHLDECIYDTTDHCITCGLLNPEHVHSYESVITEPTCTVAGHTTHTCSVCGDTYVDSEVDALGHEYDESGYCVKCGKINPELIEVGSEGELRKFNYSLNYNDDTVTINSYYGSETDVTVYGAYEVRTGPSTYKKYYTIIDGSLFQRKSNITSITFKPGITASSMGSMFSGCSSLTTINGLENIDVSKVTNMISMFDGCSSLTSLDLTGWDISNTSVDMECAFENCTALTEIKVTTGKWGNEYISCTAMMFYGCGCNRFTYVDPA